jgi:hypothetical protein
MLPHGVCVGCSVLLCAACLWHCGLRGLWAPAPILDKIDQKNYVIFWSGRWYQRVHITNYAEIANGVQITDYRYDIFRKNQTGQKSEYLFAVKGGGRG